MSHTLGFSSSKSSRMPSIPSPGTKGIMTVDLGSQISPQAPAAPQAPMITQAVTDQYFNAEKTKQGMLSTLIGRDTSLSSNISRRNKASALLV